MVTETLVDNPVINRDKTESGVFVTGAAGRIGRALRAIWGRRVAGLPIVWSARKSGQGIDIVWDIGNEPAPKPAPFSIFLHLAGQIRGDASILAENRRSAAALCAVAQNAGARHVFFMSSAAVYRPEIGLIDEIRTPNPVSDYGRAKLAAEQQMQALAQSFGLTILRLGNLAGADALLSGAGQGVVVLDPIAGQSGGPERSYIGPQTLALALERLVALAAAGQPLPQVLNLAQDPALPMADLLTAYGAEWRFGPPRDAAIPRVALSVVRLQDHLNLPKATAQSVVADLNSLKGRWP